jgi:hypothetical protein
MPTATITPILPPRSRELLRDCQRHAGETLAAILADVLTQADDVLFQLANNADSSKRQNLYFDAMRELRLKRSEVEHGFLEHFNEAFVSAAEPARPVARPALRSVGAELSLVGLDEVEETLAIGQFADSMKGRCSGELNALLQRMRVLLKASQLDDEGNPLGPRAVGNALRRACGVLSCEIEVKITLYKLFDRFGAYRLQQFYAEVNQRLIKGDVLPTLGTPGATVRSAPARKTRVIIESEQERIEGSGEDVFQTLQNLLQGQGARAGTGVPGHGFGGNGGGFGGGGFAGGGGGSAGFAQGGSAAGGGTTAGGFPSLFAAEALDLSGGGATGCAGGGFVPVPHLMETLTGLQRDALLAQPGSGPAAGGTTNVLRDLRANAAIGHIAPTQDLTLEIVSLLFDYILEDTSIPDGIKALIGRLQIPVLKVAILDKDVFSRKTHPARRLLDALGRAAVGWHAGLTQSDTLYDKIQAVVLRIVNEFDDDVALFAEVLADFEAFLAAESRAAASRAEASTRSLHTREKIVLAKLAADEALRTRTSGCEVREFVQQFLFDYWRQLLIITHVEHGMDSPDWQAQLATVDELLWSVQPKALPEDRKALSARLPQLVKDIKRGMLALEMAPTDCSRFLSMLASVHVVAIKQIEESSIAARKLARAESAAAEPPAVVDINDPASEEFIKRGLARIFERKVGEPVELDIDFSAFEMGTEDAAPAADPDVEAELGKYVEMITTLDLGDWVEFACADGSTVRGRFTWISPTTGRYLFTDRQGETVLDIALLDLAREFKSAAATIIRAESDPLLDRALGALIEKLEAQAA